MSLSGRTFYTGNFRHNLDDKGRLTIPSTWRSAHGEGDMFMAVPSTEGGYVTILPPAEVAKLDEKISAIPLGDSEAQEDVAVFMSRAQYFSFDKQGRIALNDDLLQHAAITKEAVLVGAMSKFNVYSPEAWDAIQQKRAATGAGGFLRKYGI